MISTAKTNGVILRDKLIFTDLDGTLLNHYDYSFDEASQVIEYLKKNYVPLIIVTSKTFAEVRVLQNKLGIVCPFIVENGAGIFIAPDSPLAKNMPPQNRYIKISKAKSYLELRLFFKNLQQKYSIRGFGDMQVDEVIALTGLDYESAKNSMLRDFTEPFVLDEDIDINILKAEANIEGLDVVKGGRFYHLITLHQDKAEAMKYLTHLYEENFGIKFQMIALGDSANDFTMLKAADIGILIPLSNGKYANIETTTIKKAYYPGSKGWNQALAEILDVK